MPERARGAFHDVTVPLSRRLPVWPGDPPVRIERPSRLARGDAANLTRIDMGSHTGTHVDAPYHFLEDGPPLEEIPLSRWSGPARVVAIDAPAIGARELRGADLGGARKVLFKTRNQGLMRRPRFVESYVALAPDGARLLLDRGVDLVGIDYLSIERFGAKGFPTHRTLLGAGALIVEGLDLRRVAPGDYDLLCFPLRLEGDGAPARVALVRR